MILLAAIVVIVSATILILTYVKHPTDDPEPPMYVPGEDGSPVMNPAWEAWKDRQKAKAGRSWLDVLFGWANDFLGMIGGTKTLFWIILILLAWFVWKHRKEIKLPSWLRFSRSS